MSIPPIQMVKDDITSTIEAVKTESIVVYPGVVTPQFLSYYYQIPYTAGSPRTNQSVFGALTEYYSVADLQKFQETYSLTRQSAIDIGGHMILQTCPAQNAAISCSEANLDVQYIMAMSQHTSTYYWFFGGSDIFVSFVTKIANEASPSLVNSISYGSL